MASKILPSPPGSPVNRNSNKIGQAKMMILSAVSSFIIASLINYAMMTKHLSSQYNNNSGAPGRDNDLPLASPSATTKMTKDQMINSYWWPSAEEMGGLLGKIHTIQNPANCSSPSTKFYLWRSLPNNEEDTRGLSAWAHSASSHLLHALTDGDKPEAGSRVLINDDKLFPMAKGCQHGPETRECYFEPLTKCKLSDLDDPQTEDKSKVHVLSKPGDEYDRNVRTLYSARNIWFRITKEKYSWTKLSGGREHSQMHMIAASLAYYFRAKPWLRKEIDERLKRNIPADLNPQRTIGVPIRRSDKCHGHTLEGSAAGELDCPPLETYLEKVKEFLLFDPMIENVIVTSEDKSACDEFLELLKKELPSLRVIRNIGDVQQGTGSGTKLESYNEGSSNAEVIASAMTSLHMHLRARYFVVTSKSTWTSTIAVMARVYGFATEIFALDIGPNTNDFGAFARKGSS